MSLLYFQVIKNITPQDVRSLDPKYHAATNTDGKPSLLQQIEQIISPALVPQERTFIPLDDEVVANVYDFNYEVAPFYNAVEDEYGAEAEN